MKEIAALIETGAYAREVRRILRAVRLTIALRRKLKASIVSSFLNVALAPGSEAHTRLSSYLPKVSFCYMYYQRQLFWYYLAIHSSVHEVENVE